MVGRIGRRATLGHRATGAQKKPGLLAVFWLRAVPRLGGLGLPRWYKLCTRGPVEKTEFRICIKKTKKVRYRDGVVGTRVVGTRDACDAQDWIQKLSSLNKYTVIWCNCRPRENRVNPEMDAQPFSTVVCVARPSRNRAPEDGNSAPHTRKRTRGSSARKEVR